MGLHHRPQEVQRPLLRRRLRPDDVAAPPAHAHREYGGAAGGDTVLRAAQTQRRLDVVFRRGHERRLRQPARDGGGSVRVFLNLFFIF